MAETETKPEAPKTVEDANLDVYARTFEKCLQKAEEIVRGVNRGPLQRFGAQDVVAIAEAIFRQFQHDQIELAKQNDIVNYIQNLVNRRGGGL